MEVPVLIPRTLKQDDEVDSPEVAQSLSLVCLHAQAGTSPLRPLIYNGISRSLDSEGQR